jgi:hypothetical protein
MKTLKRMSYTKIFNELDKLGYDCYRITKEESDLEGFTSGLLGYNKQDTYQIVLRKYNDSDLYVVELDTNNKELIDLTKQYFNQYDNIDYVMVNGN